MKWQLSMKTITGSRAAGQLGSLHWPRATCGKCKSKPQTFVENTQNCRDPSPSPGRIYLVQLLRVVAGNQKEDIRADILRHGIVVAHNLAVVHQEFRVGHEFGDAQHSRGSLHREERKNTVKSIGEGDDEGQPHSQSESQGRVRECEIADSSYRVYTQSVPEHASR